MKKFILYWLPVFIYAGFIFLISSLTSNQLPSYCGYDKLIHLLEYLFLGILLTRAIKNYYPHLDRKKVFFLVSIAVFSYGLSDELHQYFVPGRVTALSDALADGLGGILGNLIYKWQR